VVGMTVSSRAVMSRNRHKGYCRREVPSVLPA
jgi:hypothetical protein